MLKPHIFKRNGKWTFDYFPSTDRNLVQQAFNFCIRENLHAKTMMEVEESLRIAGFMPSPRRTLEVDRKTLDIKIPVFPGYVR